VLAPRATELIGADSSNVCRSWNVGEEDFSGLEELIESIGINTLMIQFNYGFFDLQKFSRFILKQINEKRVVAVTLHSTKDPVNAPHKKLEIIVPALKQCSRVLVHTVNDLNRLKQFGIVENCTLFPHGILDSEPQDINYKKKEEDSVQVMSYGFFLPHKGLMELIEAIAILKKSGYKLKLNMVNAEYPIEDSKRLIAEAKLYVDQNGLSDIVEFNTDFLEDSESLKLLREADLIVFPYQETGESASGAVRYGIASGRPVAVTPLEIFDDVSQAVHKLPGCSPAAIADGISKILHEIQDKSESVEIIAASANRWRKQHNYSAIGQRLNNLLTGLWSNN
jgi:glycosyltransferase involved in cell wall biosynthesis